MKLLYTSLLFVHVAGVLIWVGGMFVMHFAVRPAAVAQLPPPQRLPLMAAALGRFFFWVSIAVVAILASGLALILGSGGFRNAHVSVHVMFVLGLLMMAIYLHIRFAPFPRLNAAVAAQDWPAAGRALDSVRKLVGINLLLGFVTTAVATIGRAVL
jgi:uncharacterized membrane protein